MSGRNHTRSKLTAITETRRLAALVPVLLPRIPHTATPSASTLTRKSLLPNPRVLQSQNWATGTCLLPTALSRPGVTRLAPHTVASRRLISHLETCAKTPPDGACLAFQLSPLLSSRDVATSALFAKITPLPTTTTTTITQAMAIGGTDRRPARQPAAKVVHFLVLLAGLLPICPSTERRRLLRLRRQGPRSRRRHLRR
jgi:hypothetical protein